MKLDAKTIDLLFDTGIDLVGQVAVPGGGETVTLEREDVESFVRDKADWYARKNGVARSDYDTWIEADGLPQCGAMVNGRRCKNPVSGGGQRTLVDWLTEDSGYCVVHGGLSSSEAKVERWEKR